MNGLVKGGLALGGLVLGLGVLRRALNPTPRYAPWEKPPYSEFENKVLVVGGGFGGYTAARDRQQRHRRAQRRPALEASPHPRRGKLQAGQGQGRRYK